MTRRLTLALLALLLHIGLAPGIVLAAEPFTIVALPDTQEYLDRRTPKYILRQAHGLEDWTPYFFKQIDWIIASKTKLNTVFVVQEGDIVQTDYEPEWELAKKGFGQLDRVVPVALSVGNHDLGYMPGTPASEGKKEEAFKTAQNRSTNFDKYFPRSGVADKPWFGGSMDGTLTNAWYRFEQAGMKFMIVSLEFKPRDEAIEWANKVVSEHPDHHAIILTHAYLGLPVKGKDSHLPEVHYKHYTVPGNSGEQMWEKLVARQPNIFMVLCGHVGGQHVRTIKAPDGRDVHEVLSDFQKEELGGGSNLIYLTFDPDKKTIEGYTYNPAKNEFREGPHSRFTLGWNIK